MVCERGVDIGGIGDIQLSEVVGRRAGAGAGALSVIVASEADQVSRL